MGIGCPVIEQRFGAPAEPRLVRVSSLRRLW